MDLEVKQLLLLDDGRTPVNPRLVFRNSILTVNFGNVPRTLGVFWDLSFWLDVNIFYIAL